MRELGSWVVFLCLLSLLSSFHDRLTFHGRPAIFTNGAQQPVSNLCRSILFFTFEQCVNVSKTFLPSFKAVRRFGREVFSKRVTDDDDRRKTFFLALRGEESSLIHRVVTMDYRSSVRQCFASPHRSASSVNTSAVFREPVVVELRTFVPDHVAI